MKNYWLQQRNENGQFVALDPETFIPTRGILTRYGRKLLEGAEYYVRLPLTTGRQITATSAMQITLGL